MKKIIMINAATLASMLWTIHDVLAFGPAPEIVPEPSTWLLLGSGLAGLAAWRWYKSR